jgi:protein-disulfide isomerase
MRPGNWTDDDLVGRARPLGLDAAVFKTCLASESHDATILASSEQGRVLGVSATPTFFINGRRLQGAKSLDEFQELIDAELAAGS